ncbi:hypothetical protein PILCRDRAFT_820176 [Piloderma croceum F 1598]|uniref:Uncharacterized protein n=1 Tax=Piloderma croceum (strain F 1598) TaxID=765440 RepID=A0A0C3FEK0_PILCF|nr:hypothetical protein PILCRDRAFT_820176 [Piloderma croceum F 1598]
MLWVALPVSVNPTPIVSFNYGNYDHFRQPRPFPPVYRMPSILISYVDLHVLTCFIAMYRSPPHASWFMSKNHRVAEW